MSEGVGASRGASGGSGSCGMVFYFNSREDGGLYVTTLEVQQVFFIGDACASLGVAPTRMWCRGSNVELPQVEWKHADGRRNVVRNRGKRGFGDNDDAIKCRIASLQSYPLPWIRMLN
jgi:hypothetical protein